LKNENISFEFYMGRHIHMRVNQYGLSRDNIPEHIKREVRKRCGFGCVICGSIPFDYHHYNPPFNQAREHCADGIVLLCGGHHTEAGKGLLSVDTIKKSAASPKCLEKGFSDFSLDVEEKFPAVLFGNSIFKGNPTLIRAFGEKLFAVDKPEEPRGPCRINAVFFDRNGKMACRILSNEWQGFVSNWDIKSTGKELTIWRDRRDIVLKMRSNPPHELVIDRLDMIFRGYKIVVDTEGITTIYYPNGSVWYRLNGAKLFDNNAAIVIE